jgi:Gpi18-like mannosyltransferase
VALGFRVALVLLLRHKQTHDLRIFVDWAQLLARYGTHGFYNHVDTIDHYPINYPPLFAAVLYVVNAVYFTVHSPAREDGVLLGMLLKMPSVIADVVVCICVFVIVRRWASAGAALGALAVAAFAPSTWPISAVWGQVDSICTAFMMLALAFGFSRRYAPAWCTLALAVMIKPFPLVVAPLLFVSQVHERGWSWRLTYGPFCATVLAYLISLPFAPSVAPLPVFLWLAGQYRAGQNLTDATSVNAYNIWTLAWPVTSDSRIFAGLSLHAWGWLMFTALVVPITIQLRRRLILETNRMVRERLISEAWFIVLVAFFSFETRMHERYILYGLALVPLMILCGRSQRVAAVTLLATFTICVTLVLGFYEHSRIPEITAVTRALSLINLAALFVMLTSFFTGSSARLATRTQR